MKWEIKHKVVASEKIKRQKEIVKALLENRGIANKEDAHIFLHPKNPLELTHGDVGIDKAQLEKALKRVWDAIAKKQKIVIFGDYDADGITATATMWETLYAMGANVSPFIPHRERHGYGLSVKALEEVFSESNPELIITVDNGIVAHEAAECVHAKKIDLIITDHHTKSKTLPTAYAIVHTTKLAGAGVSWFFSKEFAKKYDPENWQDLAEKTLELATIGTVADQVPLTQSNRSIAKLGIEKLRLSKRVGLKELFSLANFDQAQVSTHHINFILAPRINAMGRLAHGLDSLRLLCTNNEKKAKKLAKILGSTNQERQDLTFELFEMGKAHIVDINHHILVVDHEDFHEGVIGLVAGKIAETYYRPCIVIGKGKEISKASARSVPGINIIELIRRAQHLLINAGGHPMAAGFTIYSENIEMFRQEMIKIGSQQVDEKLLVPSIQIDCQIEPRDISWELHSLVNSFEPFGVDNRKPLFCMENQTLIEKVTIGKNNDHAKVIMGSSIDGQSTLDALWFGKGERLSEFDKTVDIAFTVEENTWKGKSKLQLMVKDMKKSLEKEERKG